MNTIKVTFESLMRSFTTMNSQHNDFLLTSYKNSGDDIRNIQTFNILTIKVKNHINHCNDLKKILIELSQKELSDEMSILVDLSISVVDSVIKTNEAELEHYEFMTGIIKMLDGKNEKLL